jgi:hypothetical protein
MRKRSPDVGEPAPKRKRRKRGPPELPVMEGFAIDLSAGTVPSAMAWQPASDAPPVEDADMSSDASDSDSARGSSSGDAAVSNLLLNIVDEPDDLEESFLRDMEAEDRAVAAGHVERYFAEEAPVDKTHLCTRCQEYGHAIRDCPHTQVSSDSL